MSEILDRETLAAHEAGHAVLAAVQRRGFAYVTIKESHDAFGHVCLRNPIRFRYLDELNALIDTGARSVRRSQLQAAYTRFLARWEVELLLFAGGPVAEGKYSGKARISGSDARDLEAAARFLADMTGEPWLAIANRAFARANQILEEYWLAVEAVKVALLNGEKVKSAEVREIVLSAKRELKARA